MKLELEGCVILIFPQRENAVRMRPGVRRVKSTRSRGFLLCVAALRVTRRPPERKRLSCRKFHFRPRLAENLNPGWRNES